MLALTGDEFRAVFPSICPFTRTNNSVCFDDLVGCFSNQRPFDNAGDILPKSPSDINTEFFLFTPKYPIFSQQLYYENVASVRNSHFDTRYPLKIIIHGFSNNKSTPWILEMKNALLIVLSIFNNNNNNNKHSRQFKINNIIYVHSQG